MFKVMVAIIRHFPLKTLGSSILYGFGVLWCAVEIFAFFSEEFAGVIKAYWWVFAVAGIVLACARTLPRRSTIVTIPGTDCNITLRVCDLFSVSDAAFIVSTNTTFDTSIEDGTISAKSVQGQLTNRLFGSPDQLDKEIGHSLQGAEFIELSPHCKPFGKLNKYPVGTVASVTSRASRAYLVAIASMNEHQRAHATRSDVTDALPLLWEYVRTRGDQEDLAAPILGSGRSRIDATRDELVREMIRSFIPAARAGAFCTSLTIALSAADFTAGHVDLAGLSAFLHHECLYGSASEATDRSANQATHGTPAFMTTETPGLPQTLLSLIALDP